MILYTTHTIFFDFGLSFGKWYEAEQPSPYGPTAPRSSNENGTE